MSFNPFHNRSTSGYSSQDAAAGYTHPLGSGSAAAGRSSSGSPLLPTPGSAGTGTNHGSGATTVSADGSTPILAFGAPPGFYGASHLHHPLGFSPLAQPYNPALAASAQHPASASSSGSIGSPHPFSAAGWHKPASQLHVDRELCKSCLTCDINDSTPGESLPPVNSNGQYVR